jgi:hypothetical protein
MALVDLVHSDFAGRSSLTASITEPRFNEENEPPRRPIVFRIDLSQDSNSTTLSDVGVQLWTGACLLAETLVLRLASQVNVKPIRLLELRCGIGFVSIIAARYCKSVIATDIK